ncbi:MAG: DUF4864 domain-containing protein [Alphaproteobacteria bacterium]|nr:DUF4864 domain-containing protein [Alphaproteobacteria bacterium]
MRPILASLLAALAAAALSLQLAPPAAAQSAADQAAIQRLITSQIEAFRRDDGPEAFSYASPGIRRMFGSAETFMEMVRSGYQPVYRPRGFEFREIVETQGRTLQKVLVVGPDGKRVMALYTLEQQPDGSWRIAGCQLVALPEEEA